MTYYVASSIDGFIAAADGNTDVFAPGDDVLRYIVENYPDTIPSHVRPSVGLGDECGRFDTVVMGRKTYTPGLEAGITAPYRHLDQYVVSRTLGAGLDPSVTIVAADPLQAVIDLKGRDGKEIWLAGGGQLAAALMPAIDHVVLKTYPVVIGTGIPLFAGPVGDVKLHLESTRTFDSGATVASYHVAAAPPS